MEFGQSGSKSEYLESEVFVIEAAKKMFERSPDHVVGTQTLLQDQGLHAETNRKVIRHVNHFFIAETEASSDFLDLLTRESDF